jgi:hypothetical protein
MLASGYSDGWHVVVKGEGAYRVNENEPQVPQKIPNVRVDLNPTLQVGNRGKVLCVGHTPAGTWNTPMQCWDTEEAAKLFHVSLFATAFRSTWLETVL